jgi:protein involved in polysaccharide export with SLBB domain
MQFRSKVRFFQVFEIKYWLVIPDIPQSHTSLEFIMHSTPILSKHILAVILSLFIGLFGPAAMAEETLLPLQVGTIQGSVEYSEGKYRIGPGDVLSIHVYNQTEFTESGVLVRQDGYASFNGAGEIDVDGLTVDQLTRKLTERISDLVVNPIVTVKIAQMRPATVYLAGAFKQPGMYQMNSQLNVGGGAQPQTISRVDFRLANIIANAGGVNMNADLHNVEIRRKGGSQESVKVDLWGMLKEGQATDDVMVQSGDTIYIPELPHMALDDEQYSLLLRSALGPGTFPVRIIGEVAKPGIIELNGLSPYLNSAIAKAEGFKYGANRKVVAIRRFSGPNDISTIYVDPNKSDVMLRPNDVVFISEEKVYKAGRYFETAGRVLQPFTNLSTFLLFAGLGR